MGLGFKGLVMDEAEQLVHDNHRRFLWQLTVTEGKNTTQKDSKAILLALRALLV